MSSSPQTPERALAPDIQVVREGGDPGCGSSPRGRRFGPPPFYVPRELQPSGHDDLDDAIMGLASQGILTPQIADQLKIPLETVRNRIKIVRYRDSRRPKQLDMLT